MIPVVFGVGVCAVLLDSHLDRPTMMVLAGLLLLYAAVVAKGLVDHGRFVRALQRLAFDGELGGAPARYVTGVAPFVAGVLRPHMYCDPGLAQRLTRRQQRAVALHERHHVRRRDPLRLQLSIPIRPLVRVVASLGLLLDAYDVRREIAADRFAIRHGATPADVAGALLVMLEDDSLRLAPGFVTVTEARLRALSDDAVAPHGNVRRLTLTLVLAASAVVSCLILF